MIKITESVDEIKRKVGALKEREVEVTLNLGRNKIVKFVGKLKGVYPALFTVVPTDKSFKGKTSYSYSECMCGKVVINEIEKTV